MAFPDNLAANYESRPGYRFAQKNAEPLSCSLQKKANRYRFAQKKIRIDIGSLEKEDQKLRQLEKAEEEQRGRKFQFKSSSVFEQGQKFDTEYGAITIQKFRAKSKGDLRED